jgi:ankyrin repeat protein
MSNSVEAAIEAGDAARVASLISDGSLDVNTTRFKSFSETPLIVAALSGRAHIVSLLLDAGARIDDCNRVGDTACHIAAHSNRADVVDVLIARGANLGVHNHGSHTPLSLAIARSLEPIVCALISAGAPLDQPASLCIAAAMSTAVLQLLLDRGVNVAQLRDREGRTAIHIAGRSKNSLAVIQMLVRVARVDVNAFDTGGNTCCHTFAYHDNDTALRWLLSSGVEVNFDARDTLIQTPLRDAVRQNHIECVWLLLAAGADTNVKNYYGQTPLHFAARLAPLAFSLLVAASADVDVRDNAGQPPRSYAIGLAQPNTDEIDSIRRRFARIRVELVRARATAVCIGLRARDLDALCMCEILTYACGPMASLIPFHNWWQIATTVKHLRSR